MAVLKEGLPAPPSEPLLGALVAGFVLLAVGLAVLTVRRHRRPLQTPQATNRALLYAFVYGLCYANFARVIAGAILGRERSPWLLALADVIFVTLGLYVWVMVLAEGYRLRDFGFRSIPPARLALTGLMGLGAVAVYALGPYRALASGQVSVSQDVLVFAVLFAAIGSAMPEEMLFRGYLMSSLDGRTRLWVRIALPALLFAGVRSLRVAPGLGLGSPAWIFYVLGVVLPLGLWWGLMRELAGGAIWPCLASHFLLEFGPTVAGAPAGLP